MIRMTKNFASGAKMLWQRLCEGTYEIKFVPNEDFEKAGWSVGFRQLPVQPFIVNLRPNRPFKTWNEAHDFATDVHGAHFNVEFFT